MDASSLEIFLKPYHDYTIKGEFESLTHQLELQLRELLEKSAESAGDATACEPTPEQPLPVNVLGSFTVATKRSTREAFEVVFVDASSCAAHTDSDGTAAPHLLNWENDLKLLTRLEAVWRGSIGAVSEDHLAFYTGCGKLCVAKPVSSAASSASDDRITTFAAPSVPRSLARYRLSLVLNAMLHNHDLKRRSAHADDAPIPLLSSVHDVGQGSAVGIALGFSPNICSNRRRLRVNTFAADEGPERLRSAKAIAAEMCAGAATACKVACRLDWTCSVTANPLATETKARVYAESLAGRIIQLFQDAHVDRWHTPVYAARARNDSDLRWWWPAAARSVAVRAIHVQPSNTVDTLPRRNDVYFDVDTAVKASDVGVHFRMFWEPFNLINRTNWREFMSSDASLAVCVTPTVWSSLIECEAAGLPRVFLGNAACAGFLGLRSMVLHSAVIGSSVALPHTVDGAEHVKNAASSSTFEWMYSRLYAQYVSNRPELFADVTSANNVFQAVHAEGERICTLPDFSILQHLLDEHADKYLATVEAPLLRCLKADVDHNSTYSSLNDAAKAASARFVAYIAAALAAYPRVDSCVRSVCKDAHYSLLEAIEERVDLRSAAYSLWIERFCMFSCMCKIWKLCTEYLKAVWDARGATVDRLVAKNPSLMSLRLDYNASFLQQSLHTTLFCVMLGRSADFMPMDEHSFAATAHDDVASPSDIDVVSPTTTPSASENDETLDPPALAAVPPISIVEADFEWRSIRAKSLGLTVLRVARCHEGLRQNTLPSHVGWTTPLVRADMVAFRSVNPLASELQFLQWYFENAFVPNETCTVCAAKNHRKQLVCGRFHDAASGAEVKHANSDGTLTIHASEESTCIAARDFWRSLWHTAKPSHSAKQLSLFNPHLAVEFALNVISDIPHLQTMLAMSLDLLDDSISTCNSSYLVVNKTVENMAAMIQPMTYLLDNLRTQLTNTVHLQSQVALKSLHNVSRSPSEDESFSAHASDAMQRVSHLVMSSVPPLQDMITACGRIIHLLAIGPHDAAAVVSSLGAEAFIREATGLPSWHAGWHINTDDEAFLQCVNPSDFFVSGGTERPGASIWSRLKHFASQQHVRLVVKRRPTAALINSKRNTECCIHVPLSFQEAKQAEAALQSHKAYFAQSPARPSPNIACSEITAAVSINDSLFTADALRGKDVWGSRVIATEANNNMQAAAASPLLSAQTAAQRNFVKWILTSFSSTITSDAGRFDEARVFTLPDSQTWLLRNDHRVALTIAADGSVAIGNTGPWAH